MFSFGRVAQPLLNLHPDIVPTSRHAVTLILIFAFTWLLVSLTSVLDEYLHDLLFVGVDDPKRARRIYTKVGLLRRFLVAIIVILGVVSMLMIFPEARILGASVLAAAGIAGIIIGVAAWPAVETLIAGFQLALTDRIHIDDVVIVEGEWGWIEEITMTYVVVRIWDLRRLIIPITYFLTQPFQNWTHAASDLLGQVTVDVDYTTPVDEVRKAVGEIVESCTLWDKKFWNLQVVESGGRTMRLRVLATAPDSRTAWDLRCEIREKLIAYLQQHHPESLPRLRAVIDTSSDAAVQKIADTAGGN